MKTDPLLIWNLNKATEAYTMSWSGSRNQSEGMWLWLASCTATETPQSTHPTPPPPQLLYKGAVQGVFAGNMLKATKSHTASPLWAYHSPITISGG